MSAQAEDSGRYLAMTRPSPIKIKTSGNSLFVTEPVRSSPALTKNNITAKTSLLKAETDPQFSTTPQIDNQANPSQRNPLVLVNEKLNPNHSLVVAAGYGRLWNDQSMLHYISPGRQEPGCAYVKASFNF